MNEKWGRPSAWEQGYTIISVGMGVYNVLHAVCVLGSFSDCNRFNMVYQYDTI